MKKALFIGYVWPEPNTTAAGHRMLQLLKTFIPYEHEITFATTASHTSYSESLEDLGIATKAIHLNDPSFDHFIKELQPDVVIFDRFMVEEQFGWRVAENAPNALRILNTEDLHSLRKARETCHKNGVDFNNGAWLQNDITKREVASIYRSDLTLLVSSFEMELLERELNIPSALVYHLPFLLKTISSEEERHWPAFEARTDFICFGNGKHAPNVDAIKYLKTAIWPLIKKELPEAKLNIFGAYLPQQIQELHQPKDGFYVKGWIDDLNTELQNSRINLVPLRFGAGIKGKLTHAMQNGTPTVSTSIGVEGMFADAAMPVAVANNAKEFAKVAITLYKDKSQWTYFQSKGIKAINTRYNKKTLVPMFFNQLDKLQKNLMEHRTANFIGSLLQHQTMAATKYMSKWIEEKNRKK